MCVCVTFAETIQLDIFLCDERIGFDWLCLVELNCENCVLLLQPEWYLKLCLIMGMAFLVLVMR